MGFGQAISSGFKNYVNFSGRAMRSEFWWWFLFVWLVGVAANLVDMAMGRGSWELTQNAEGVYTYSYENLGIFGSLWALAIILPTIAVAIRRLHDTDHSGWWWLLGFVCCIGPLILIFAFYIQPGTPGDNRFGPPRQPNTV